MVKLLGQVVHVCTCERKERMWDVHLLAIWLEEECLKDCVCGRFDLLW